MDVEIENAFKQFLAERYGLYIHLHQVEKLRQAIGKICRQFDCEHPQILLEKLKKESFCAENMSLIQQMTVDESYFFRDKNQQHFLRHEFFPDLIAQKRLHNDKHLRVWSAGCSIGQEIYSIAILLHQLLPDFSDWQLTLIGSDINHQALKQAVAAEYNSWDIRNDNDFVMQSSYFIPLNNEYYRLHDKIKKQVKFFFLNLAEDVFPSLMNQTCFLDLILCRNVFIYFQPEAVQKTCAKFCQALRPGGVLLLSASDPMNITIPELPIKQSGNVFYFRRMEESLETVNSVENLTLQIDLPEKPLASPAMQQNIQKEDFSTIKHQILFLLGGNQWHNVVESCNVALLDSPQNSELLQFKAKALLNLGFLDEAQSICEQSIHANDLDPHGYLLYGSILMQLNLYDEAEKAFRKTIFLNHDFMEAHYQLGQVLLYKGQKAKALKAIKNALHLAEQGDPLRPVHNVMTLTYSSFAETLRNEMSILYKAS